MISGATRARVCSASSTWRAERELFGGHGDLDRLAGDTTVLIDGVHGQHIGTSRCGLICRLAVRLEANLATLRPEREPDRTNEPPDQALVIGRSGSGLSRVTGTVIAAACLLGAATIVLNGYYLLIF